jgi:Tol biopolymer transport system component
MKVAALIVSLVLSAAVSAGKDAGYAPPDIDLARWSPNGRWLAFRGVWGDTWRLRVARDDGRARRTALTWGKPVYFEWAPSSRQLAATDGTTTWIFTASGRLVGQTPGQFEDWAPDSNRFLATRNRRVGTTGGTIFVVDVSGFDARELGFGGWPDWSPGGGLIAFSVDTYGTCRRARIFVAPTTGGQPRQVTPDVRVGSGQVADLVSPQWSPGGRQIAYAEMVLGKRGCPILGVVQHPEAFSVARSGGREVALGRGYPVWSPRGNLLALVDWSHLELVTPAGRPVARFEASGAFGFDWSPDGRSITYVTGDRNAIYVAAATGRKRKRVANGDGPDWSPLGRIAFIRRAVRGGMCGARVFTVRPDGGPLRPITPCRG